VPKPRITATTDNPSPLEPALFRLLDALERIDQETSGDAASRAETLTTRLPPMTIPSVGVESAPYPATKRASG